METIAYLTFEGVRFFEELELACRQRTVDLKPYLRRVHLVVTAIHEFIQTVDAYAEFKHFDKEAQDRLRELQTTVMKCLIAPNGSIIFIISL